MKRHVVEGYLLLLWFELLMACRGFKSLHREVQRARQPKASAIEFATAEELSRSMDLACVFYPKRVLCLQRSAATTILLRRYGIQAEMVIGAQMLPFKSHAWVEVAGVVVNDRPYMREIYQELETL